jgi:Domain of Unknown Function (DUF748)
MVGKLKRFLLIFTIIALVFVALVIIFISPITKYLIQKYDEKYTGRQITLDWAYVNPFTGYLHLQNLKIYEYKSDSIFLAASGLSVHVSVSKFFSHTVQINSATLDNLVVHVIKDHKTMNFGSIIEKLSGGDSTQSTNKKKTPLHVNLGTLKITNGEIHYNDKQIPFIYYIKRANFETPGKRWDVDTMAFTYSFASGPTKGSMEGRFDVNFKTSAYRLSDRIVAFDLKPMEQYAKDLANYGNTRAVLDANLTAAGNFHNAEDIVASGHIALSDFHLGKNPEDDYMSFEQLRLVVTELSPRNNKYILDSLSLVHPYVKYERYDHTDNLSTMFAKKGAGNGGGGNGDPEKLNIIISIGRYIKSLSREFFNSDYKLNNLAISGGELTFNDFSLSEEFSTGLHGLSIVADSINKSRRRVNIFLHSALKPYGNMVIKLSIDPNDSSYYNLNYHIENIPVSLFNPYTVTFTSFPLDRGTIELNGAWNVLGGNIDSKNHLIIVDPRATKRVRGKDKKWLPLPLIFAFIRERGDVIDYEIPITGSLKNPKFHFHDAIMHLLQNIFVKPVTTPYRFEVKNTEKAIEKSLMIKWPLMSSYLLPSQDKFLSETAEFLEKNTEVSMVVHPYLYTIKEKEHINFFEAKKNYFMFINHLSPETFTEKDSLSVNNLAIRDSGFLRYLNARVKDKLLFTLQEKCARLVGTEKISSQLKRLNKTRQQIFMDYFKKRGVADRVKLQDTKNTIPFDGFSYYEIQYKGDIPPVLLKAYQKMNELNAESPRIKYRKEHKKALP